MASISVFNIFVSHPEYELSGMFRNLSNESDPNHGVKVDNCTMDSLRITVRCKLIMEMVASIVVHLTLVANNAGERAQHHEEVNIWKWPCGWFRIQISLKLNEFPVLVSDEVGEPQLSAQSSIEYIP